MPARATVKSLSIERPKDAGAAEVRCRHDVARRLAGLFERVRPRRINFRNPARLASFRSEPLLIATNAVELAIFDQCALELCHRGEDCEQPSPVGRGRVDLPLVEHFQIGALRFDRLQDVSQVHHRPLQPVQLGARQHVPIAQQPEAFFELRPVGRVRAGDQLGKDVILAKPRGLARWI